MNLKMKFAAITVALGTGLSNAQPFDIAKERIENPKGAKALECVAVAAVILAELDPKSSAYAETGKFVEGAYTDGLIIYGFNNVFNMKSVAAIDQLQGTLVSLKLNNPSAHLKLMSGLHKTRDACAKMYPSIEAK